MNVFGGIPPTIEVAGRILTDTANIKVLRGWVSSNANTGFLTPASVAYQVPVGKQFRVVGVKQLAPTASANGYPGSIGYADASLGIDVATAPTNPQYAYAGTTNLQMAATALHALTTAGEEMQGFQNFIIPAEKYPIYSRSSGVASIVELYGYEEAV